MVLHLRLTNAIRRPHCIAQRLLSVRELPWCAPSGSPTRRTPPQHSEVNASATCSSSGEKEQRVPKFGVVAAMSKNRIIGVNGKLPWACPRDRENFKRLTRDRVIIIGRNTYEEEPDKSHISHVKCCIVVSKKLSNTPVAEGRSNIQVAPSLPEALALARNTLYANGSEANDKESDIQVWVAGGQSLYEEALQHPSAQEVHLTTINTEITVQQDSLKIPKMDGMNLVSMFPAKHRWDRNFKEVVREDGECGGDDDANPLSFIYVTYERK